MSNLEAQNSGMALSMNLDMLAAHLDNSVTGFNLLTETTDRAQTAQEFVLRSRKLAGGLQGLGLEQGARVAILSLNSLEYVEGMLGTMLAGMVTVPLNIRWSPAELIYALDHSGIEAILFDDVFAPAVAAIKDQAKTLKVSIYAGQKEAPEGSIAYESLLGDPVDLQLDRDPETDCLISYTGGTTGFPKGVVHTHRSLLASSLIQASNNFPIATRTYINVMPLFHIAGFGLLFSRLLQNQPMVLMPAFRPDLIGALIKKYNIGSIGMAPVMIQMYLNDPAFNAEDFSGLEQQIYGASPISKGLLDQFLETLPHVQMTQAYGMTEAGIGIFLGHQFHTGPLANPAAAGQSGSPMLRIAIEDDNGTALPAGEVGEIVLYSPGIMSRYYNDPEQTAEVRRNGGYRTGDVGVLDENGVLSLKDRAKDMIISGGENVYSAEVESALSTHPEIAQVAVIGIPDEQFGEAVHAVIVPAEGKEPSFDDVRAYAHDKIAGYKCPRSISLIDALPLSAMNKVLKNELRAPFWEGHDRGIS